LVPSNQSPQILNPTSNPIVQGSFTPSATNYIGIEFVRAVDDSTADTVYFWDPNSNTEFSKNVPLALILGYNIYITTTPWASNVMPVCTVATDANNNVTSITDCRELLYRLGSGNSASPNPNYVYPWTAQPEGRVESPSTASGAATYNPFQGGDKMLTSFKDWANAIMSMIREVKGTPYWYSATGAGFGSMVTLREDAVNSILTGAGTITHNASVAGRLNWSSSFSIEVVGTPLKYTIAAYNAGSVVSLTNGQCAYLNLARNLATAVNLTFSTGSPSVVTGASAWTTGLQAGDFVRAAQDNDNVYGIIASVDSPTQVTLTTAYAGTTAVSVPAVYTWGNYSVGGSLPATSTPSRNLQASAIASVPLSQNTLWLFYRNDGVRPKVYVRFLGVEIEQGETTQIDDSVSQNILTYIGAQNEADSAPSYSTQTPAYPTTSNNFLGDGASLTNALRAVDLELDVPLRPRANLVTPDQNLYFEDSSVTGGDGTKKTVAPVKNQVFFSLTGSSINFNPAQPVGTPAGNFNVASVTPVDTNYYAVGFSLGADGKIQVVFSTGSATLIGLQTPAVIGALFPSTNAPIGYVYLQYLTASGWRTAGSASAIIENGQIFRFGSGSGGGTSGGGLGDDLITSLFQASFLDDFTELPTDSSSAVNAGDTNGTYLADKQLYQLSYDATQTASTTTTAVTMSSAPSFTVDVGDMIFNGTNVRRITAVASQTSYTIESAFPVDLPVLTPVTVSQAVNTVDIYNATINGNALSAAFTSTFAEILVDYEDTTAVGDAIFDVNTVPVIGFIGSSDNSNWSPLTVRPTLALAQVNTLTLPTFGTSLYLRFFANKTSGSGSVNILKYKAYMQRALPTGSTPLNYAYGYTNSSVTPVNATVSVIGGKTTVTFNWTYALGIETGSPYGSIDVYLNGQLVPRFLAGVTVDAYYTEYAANAIQFDTNYSSVAVSFEVIKRVNVVYATTTTNSTASVGSGSKNYFTANNNNANPVFDTGITSPWTPTTVTLTSGVPTTAPTSSATNITFVASSVNPLIGTFSALLTKSASNSVGQGVISGPMVIDREDTAKVLYGSFSYEVVSGTVDFSGASTQSLEIWIYNTVSGAWTQPAGYRGMNQTSGAGKVTFSFQTDGAFANNTYRVAIITAQTDTNGYSVRFDDFELGPTAVINGTPVTDWQTYSLSITASTTNPILPSSGLTVNQARYRRIGDSIQIQYQFETGTVSGGNNGSGTYFFSMPSGLTIDSSKVSVGTVYGVVLGTARANDRDGVVTYTPSQTNRFSVLVEAGGTSLASIDSSGLYMTSNNQGISFVAQFPVVGFSSNVQISSDTDTRVVDFAGSQVSQAVTANVTNISFTTIKDTHGSWSTNQYNVPVSGDYLVSGSFIGNAIGAGDVYKNGIRVGAYLGGSIPSAGASGGGSALVTNCVAGDNITLRFTQNATITGGYLSIHRLSGPSVIAATETVAASYWLTANFTTSPTIPINFDGREYDTHNAVTPSLTAWKFTAPVSGIYQVSIVYNHFSGSGNYYGYIYKNGTLYKSIIVYNVNSFPQTGGTTDLRLNAGEYIDIRANAVVQGGALNATSSSSNIAIKRVGN
jgi:hypothetical protein